jgi:hypothetical protein
VKRPLLIAVLPALMGCSGLRPSGDDLVASRDLSEAGGHFVPSDAGLAAEFSSLRVKRGELRDVVIIQKIAGGGWTMAGQRASAIAFAFRVDCAAKSYKLAWQDFFDAEGTKLGHLEATMAKPVSDPRHWRRFALYCSPPSARDFEFRGVSQFLALTDARESGAAVERDSQDR